MPKLFTNMLLLRIHSSPYSSHFCSFFLALQYLSCCCDSSHILFQTVYFRDTGSTDTVQVPRQSRRDSCHISISCGFHGLPVLPFILCYHVPWLSHYSCGNTPGNDTFLTSRCQMLQFWNTIKSEKNTSTQNGLKIGRILCSVVGFKTDVLLSRFII